MANIPISTKPQLNYEMEAYTTQTPAYGPTFTASMKQLLENDKALENKIAPATKDTLGRVQPDGTTITVNDKGVISAQASVVEITKSAYDALPDTKYTDGVVRFVKDYKS